VILPGAASKDTRAGSHAFALCENTSMSASDSLHGLHGWDEHTSMAELIFQILRCLSINSLATKLGALSCIFSMSRVATPMPHPLQSCWLYLRKQEKTLTVTGTFLHSATQKTARSSRNKRRASLRPGGCETWKDTRIFGLAAICNLHRLHFTVHFMLLFASTFHDLMAMRSSSTAQLIAGFSVSPQESDQSK